MKYLFKTLILVFRFNAHIAHLIRWDRVVAYFRQAYWKARLARMGERSKIYKNVVVHQPEMVSIGNGSSLCEFVHIWGGGGVSIGNNVLVASHVSISSLTHEKNTKIFAMTIIRKPIVIEDNCWIGSGATILPGLKLNQGCIVGAGAVVTKDVPANSIVVGVPAKVIFQKHD